MSDTKYEFKLPDLGEGVHEAEILQWFVAEGERIEEDAPLVEVETDKATVSIPSPKAGVVARLGGKVGDIIRVGEVVAVIETAAGAAAEPPADSQSKTEAGAPVPSAEGSPPSPVTPASTAPVSAFRGGGPVPAAPATRRLARELGVELRAVSGSGPAGRVTADDVRAHAEGGEARAEVVPINPSATAAASAPAEPAPRNVPVSSGSTAGLPLLDLDPLPDFSQWGLVRIEPLRSIRRKTARRMVTAKTLVPHVAHMDEADVTELEALRRRFNQTLGPDEPRLTLLPFVARAVAAGLREWPQLNASVDPFNEQIVFKDYCHLGIAVDTERGLMVPVIRDADRMSIVAISRAIRERASGARDGSLQASDFQGGSFTLTNVGPLGGTAVVPAINYPEVAILGMARVQDKAVVRDGQVVVRSVLGLTLSFDHRVADGADAARFVTQLKQHLEDPERFFLEA